MHLGGCKSVYHKGVFSAIGLVIHSSNSRNSQIYSVHFHIFFFHIGQIISVLSSHRILLGSPLDLSNLTVCSWLADYSTSQFGLATFAVLI